MDLIQSSKDLLYVVISFCILLITVFLSWLIFYVAMIARQFFGILKGAQERVRRVDEALHAFKEKMEHSASYLLLIGEGIKKLVEVAIEYRSKKKAKSKSR